MATKFKLKAVKLVDEVIESISDQCKGNGLAFNGSCSVGEIKGMGVRITYTVAGKTVLVTLHKKPFFISTGMIENEIKSRSLEFGIIFLGRI